jgi:hypothetical protein
MIALPLSSASPSISTTSTDHLGAIGIASKN